MGRRRIPLHNIPVRTELGHKIREAFREAFCDSALLTIDYSSIEPRILEHLERQGVRAVWPKERL
jgi:DNA polymerase-1